MTDQPDAPRPPGVDNLLAAVADALPPCCPADWAEDIEEHAADCPLRPLEAGRNARLNRRATKEN